MADAILDAGRAAPALKTLKVRVKDKHAGVLRRMARDVNQVWNF